MCLNETVNKPQLWTIQIFIKKTYVSNEPDTLTHVLVGRFQLQNERSSLGKSLPCVVFGTSTSSIAFLHCMESGKIICSSGECRNGCRLFNEFFYCCCRLVCFSCRGINFSLKN